MESKKYGDLSYIIVNESNNMIYVSDIESYDLIFVNKALRDKLGIKEGYQGEKCYKLLQGLDAPCPFCTNYLLNGEQFYTWKHYNKHLGRYYELKDKLVEMDGNVYRMEICVDITDAEEQQQALETQLTTEETLVACIHTLSQNTEINSAIDQLLGIIGNFYQAERAYIFEIDYENQLVNNSYEWCKDSASPQIHNLKNLPISSIERWMELFYGNSEVYINSLTDVISKDSLEYQILAPQGIDSLMATPMWENGEIMGFIGVDNPTYATEQVKLLKSITYFIKNDIEKRSLLNRLKELSYRDELTGLGNRNQYIDEVERLQKATLESLGVVFIDINGLKKANDQYGHEYGDRMIQNVAQGVKNSFPKNSYRIGGDEFVAFFIDGTKEEFALRLEKLRKYEKEDCICDFSLGVTFNEDVVKVKEQIGYSDDMMYVEKKLYYGHAQEGKNNYHEALAKELVEDIEKGLFEVYLQPKMRLDTEDLVGAEALVRRKGEDGTLILPNHFIPLYEAEGIIQYLDMFVFEQVCRMLCEWNMRELRLIPISVNFSRVSLMGKDVVNQLTRIRDSYQIKPEFLKIELMENINKMNQESLTQMMQKFNEQGFDLSLDDYGASAPDNSILTKMDFKEIKIDRSLVHEIVDNQRARVVLEHSLLLGKSLGGMDTVAEGIENLEQLDILKGYDCMIGQGFVFSKPMPMIEFEEKYAEKYLK